MATQIPLIIIYDPVKYDYQSFVRESIKQLHELESLKQHVHILIIEEIETTSDLNRALSSLYAAAREAVSTLGFDYKFEIDVFYNETTFKLQESVWGKTVILAQEQTNITSLYWLANWLANKSDETLVLNLALQEIDRPKGLDAESSKFASYQVSAVGGTFDHIHDGHKILLSMALFVTSQKLIVGITGPELLKNKKYSEVLESFETRQSKTVNSIKQHMNEGTSFEIYEINDVCGPTGYIKDIQALIVSGESTKGGDFVNKVRMEKGWSPLTVIAIDVIGGNDSNEDNNWQGKLSSTEIRKEEYLKLYRGIS